MDPKCPGFTISTALSMSRKELQYAQSSAVSVDPEDISGRSDKCQPQGASDRKRRTRVPALAWVARYPAEREPFPYTDAGCGPRNIRRSRSFVDYPSM